MDKNKRKSSTPELSGMEVQEAKALTDIVHRFLKFYGDKPQDMDDKAWMSKRLAEELEGKQIEETDAIAMKMMDGIEKFEQNMASLNEACKEGQGKDEWFRDQSQNAAIGMNVNVYGNKLANVNRHLLLANYELLCQAKVDAKPLPSGLAGEPIDKSDWNNYNTRDLALHLGNNAALSGLCMIMLTDGHTMLGIGQEIGQHLLTKDRQNASDDIDAIALAMAGALYVWLHRSQFSFLQDELSGEMIAIIVCAGKKYAENLQKVSNDEMSDIGILENAAELGLVVVYMLCWSVQLDGKRLLPLLHMISVCSCFISSIYIHIGVARNVERVADKVRHLKDVAKPIAKGNFGMVRNFLN